MTLEALHTNGILDAVLNGLTNPVPSGPDGDVPGPDADFEEKGVVFVIHLVSHGAQLTVFNQTASHLRVRARWRVFGEAEKRIEVVDGC